MKTMEQLWNEITTNKELAEKLKGVSSDRELEAFLKENEVDCTKEQFGEFILSKKGSKLSDEELRIIAGGRDGEGNDSKPDSVSTPTAIALDENGRAILWQDGKDIYHYECYKCHKWLYKDWVRWYCPKCGEGFYWNVEEYRVYDVKGN